MKTTTVQKIEKVVTLNDFLNILESDFKTEECKPGRLTKGIVINLITSKLSGQNPILINALKVKALEAENIKEFIKIIRREYNGDQNFTEAAKAQLVENTNRLVGLTFLKERDSETATKKAPAKKAVATKKAPAKKVVKRRK